MSDSSTLMLFVRMGVSLAVILGLIWIAARVVKRSGTTKVGSTTSLDVVGRRSVGRRSSLLVVDVGDRRYLIGATDTNVSLIADLSIGERDGTTDNESDEAVVNLTSLPERIAKRPTDSPSCRSN